MVILQNCYKIAQWLNINLLLSSLESFKTSAVQPLDSQRAFFETIIALEVDSVRSAEKKSAAFPLKSNQIIFSLF